MTRKVTICRNAERRLRRKAFTLVLMIVGQPHRAANADITVPEKRSMFSVYSASSRLHSPLKYLVDATRMTTLFGKS